MEAWPKPKSIYERLMNTKKATDPDLDDKASLICAVWLALFQSETDRILGQGSPNSSGVVLAMDENVALEYALRECLSTSAPNKLMPLLPNEFWV